MTSVQFGFHADAKELIDHAVEWVETHRFRLAAEQYFPEYRVLEFKAPTSTELLDKLDKVDRLVLSPSEFDLTASTTNQFVTRNDRCLYLSVEWATDQGLRESSIGGVTDDEDLLRIWRRMIRQLKKSMHKGATIRGWTGITAPAPSHRHTLGAHALAEQGVPMLAVAGRTAYLFDDVRRGEVTLGHGQV